jgi:hypothetical protein
VKTALAVPAASVAATAMETPEAATRMAEASDMGDTHAVGETATPEMGDIYAAVGETVTSDMCDTHAVGETGAAEMGGTYAAAETHSVMGDGALGAHAHMAEAVAVPAIKYSPAGIVVVTKVIRACRGTAVSRIVDRPRWTGVLAGIGLAAAGCDPANAAVDNPMPVANKTTLVENLLRIIAASLGDLPHSLNLFQSGRSTDRQQWTNRRFNHRLQRLTPMPQRL